MSKNSDWYKQIGDGGGQMTNNQARLVILKLSRLKQNAISRANDVPKPEYADYHHGQVIAYQNAIELIQQALKY